MGCDEPSFPRAQSPWAQHGITYDEWFELFPVTLRAGRGLVCSKCGVKVAEKGAKLHREWHRRGA